MPEWWDTIKELFGLKGPDIPPSWVKGSTGQRVKDTDEGKLFTIIAGGKCPDCFSEIGFYEGPSGGMSTNYFCANRACRSGFNVTPFGDGQGIAERIHKGDIYSYPEET